MKTKKQIIILWSVAAVCVAVILALMLVESANSRCFKIRNKTNSNIEKIYLGVVDDEFYDLYGCCEVPVAKKSSYSGKYYSDMIFSADKPGQLYMEICIEGKNPVSFIEGSFGRSFSGRIDVDIYEENGDYFVKANAKTGLFGSKQNFSLNNITMKLNFEEGFCEYID